MKCTKCGYDNPPEAKFCGRCGAATQVAPPEVPNVPSPVSSELKIGIAIGSVIIPLLGIIMGAIYLNDANPEKKKAGKLWLFIGLGAFGLWTCLWAASQSGY